MMQFTGKLVAAVIFSVISYVVAIPLGATFNVGRPDAKTGVFVILAVVAVVAVIIWFAPTIRRAFGRGFLLTGLLFLALPLTSMALSGSVAAEMMSDASAANLSGGDQAATAIGSTIAVGVVTGIATFVGPFLGAIFVIVGLVLALGGRREVIVVNQAR